MDLRTTLLGPVLALLATCMTAHASPLVLECRGVPPAAPDPAFAAAFCDALQARFAVLEPDIPVAQGDAAEAAAAGGVHVGIDLSEADRYGLTVLLTVTADGQTQQQELSVTVFDLESPPGPDIADSLLLPILRLAGQDR